MKLADPAGLLHHHSSEVVQGVEQTEEDGLVGIKILHLLLDEPLHQQTELAGPTVSDRELERHVELLTLNMSLYFSAPLSLLPHLVSEDPEDPAVSVPDAGGGNRFPDRLRADGGGEKPRSVRVSVESCPESLQDGARHSETSLGQAASAQYGSPASGIQFLSWP